MGKSIAYKKFFTLCVFGSILLFVLPQKLYALSYQEKKDRDALATMESILKRLPVKREYMEGNELKKDTNLIEVRLYLDRIYTGLKSADSVWRNISADGKTQAKAREIAARQQTLREFSSILSQAYQNSMANKALSDADKMRSSTAASGSTVVVLDQNNQAKQQLQKTCKEFRRQLNPSDRQSMKWFVQLQAGQSLFVQDVNELNRYSQAANSVKQLCSKAEFANIQTACQAMTSFGKAREGEYCAAAANGQKLLKQAVSNYAAFLIQQQGSAGEISTEMLKQQDGWVRLEGAVTWNSIVSGGNKTDVIIKRITPLLAAMNMGNKERENIISHLNVNASKLAKVIESLAGSWTMPGTSCQGAPCQTAVNVLMQWYPKAKILKNNQHHTDWKIRQHEVSKIPIERYRSGWTLLKLPSDPLCQLRSWTVYEKYQGGGKYQSNNNVHIGYVRWQKCG